MRPSTNTAFTQRDVVEFLDTIAAAPAFDLPRHEARLASARRLNAIDRVRAVRIADAITQRRADLAGAPTPDRVMPQVPAGYRAPNGLMRVRQLSTGLVFERYAPDARAMVETAAFAFAKPDELTIAERLDKLPHVELTALCARAGVSLPPATRRDPRPEIAAISRLVPLLERGVVAFPTATEAKP